MGTHPIFESDFDCLTEKWVLKSIATRKTSSTFEQPNGPMNSVDTKGFKV